MCFHKSNQIKKSIKALGPKIILHSPPMARVPRESPKYNYCFTSFNDESPAISFKDDVHRYLLVGDETCPRTGRHHWQCYVQYLKKARKASVLKDFPGLASDAVQQCKGSFEQNYTYCTKSGEFVEFGVPNKTPGQRNDLLAAVDASATMSFGQLMVSEHAPVVARSMQFFRTLYTDRARAVGMAAAEASIVDCILRPWQIKLLDTIKLPACPRSINWIWDSAGNTGKSFMAKYLMVRHDATIFTNGKIADIAFAYNFEPVVIFDLARTQADKIDHIYQVAESFKNGVLFSSKYESGKKVFCPPHVVVFANFPPEAGKLSADRLKGCVHEIKSKYSRHLAE